VRLGLRTRVALAFAVLSLLVAGTVSAATYGFARWYLLNQREAAAMTRAALDARSLDAALLAGEEPGVALAEVPSVGTSQPMVRVGDEWYTASVTVPPDALPAPLIEQSAVDGGRMRFASGDEPYLGVAIPVSSGLYVEVFPLRDLDRTLTLGGWILIGLTVLTGLLGALIGATATGQVLGPVRRVGHGARRIASGDLSARIELTGDRDLDPIATSFNDMAEAVQARIARERRFAANVSHELRSPVTSVLGTAELLESRTDRLPVREAGLVGVLVHQVRRMAQTLLDLLEISRMTDEGPPQWESADVAALCREVLAQRGCDPGLVLGDDAPTRTDARRLERIVGNLVDNAVRHGGGVTAVRVERDDVSLRLVVEDAGPGVAADRSEHLFEPFTRGDTEGATEGAGLGLAIVRDQAQALRGDVVVENRPEGGARFTVTLPLTEQATS
jgi:signal transduction histidine kinase